MKKLFFILLPLCLCLETSALNIEFTAGTGNWNVAANWSTGTIPTPADNVTIPINANVTVPSGYNARMKTLSVRSGALLHILNNGRLRIIAPNNTIGLDNIGTIHNSGLLVIRDLTLSPGISAYAFNNDGVFINYGTLRFRRIDYIGLYNDSNGITSNFGLIDLTDDIEGPGIVNHNDFNNYKYVQIDGTSSTSIINEGDLNNSGQINISASDYFSIHNEGVIQNDYKAFININDSTNDAINNVINAAIINDGEITIDFPGGTGNVGIDNFGSYENDSRGITKISNCYNPIFSQGALTNRGTIELIDGITNVGINLLGTATNDAGALISISDFPTNGIYISDLAVFENAGELHISNPALGGTGMYIRGEITNQSTGSITCTRLNGAITNEGLFENYGEINAIDGFTSSTIGNIGTFNNYENAVLSLNNISSSTGLNVSSSGLFNNEGAIEIIADPNVLATGLYVSGTFHNLPLGVINIEQTAVNGMFLQTTGELTNEGALYVSPINVANGLSSYGSITNSGNMSFEDSGFNGNSIQIYTSGTFTNEGSATLDLRSTNNTYLNGIRNYGLFENLECATLTYQQRINNELGATFNNEAWMFDSYDNGHTNDGQMTNFGAIQDNEPSFQSTSIQNEGAIIEFIQGPISASSVIPNVLEIGPTPYNYLKTIDWYTDANLSNYAGEYDMFSNAFDPSNNAIGSTELHFPIYSVQQGCAANMIIPVPGGINLVHNPGANPNQMKTSKHELAQTPSSVHTQAFPNPTSGAFNISTTLPDGEYQIDIYNQLGQQILSQVNYLNSNIPHAIQLPSNVNTGLLTVQISGNGQAPQNLKILHQINQ